MKPARYLGISSTSKRSTARVAPALRNCVKMDVGDEILYADVDYDNVQQLIKDVASRKQLSTRRISIADPLLSDDDIIQKYERAITENTRVIMLTHLLHRNGQILPIANISKMAKRYKVDAIVDAAHSFAQLNYQFPDLGSDFIGINLHKWLGAPLGTGLLYVKRSRITGLTGSSVTKIEWLKPAGTYSPAPIMAITDAIHRHP